MQHLKSGISYDMLDHCFRIKVGLWNPDNTSPEPDHVWYSSERFNSRKSALVALFDRYDERIREIIRDSLGVKDEDIECYPMDDRRGH